MTGASSPPALLSAQAAVLWLIQQCARQFAADLSRVQSADLPASTTRVQPVETSAAEATDDPRVDVYG